MCDSLSGPKDSIMKSHQSGTIVMRSLTELLSTSQASQEACERVLEAQGISGSIIQTKPLADKLLMSLLKLKSKEGKKDSVKIEGNLDDETHFERGLRLLDPVGAASSLRLNEDSEVKPCAEARPSESLNASFLNAPTTSQEYDEFWSIVSRLNPKVCERDAPEISLEKRLHISLDWLAKEHFRTLGDESASRCANPRYRLINFEQYVRISQTTLSVLLNDPDEPGAHTFKQQQEVTRHVMIPHVVVWVIFEATRCLETEVLRMVSDLVHQASEERRALVLNLHGDRVRREGVDDEFLSLSTLSLSDLECIDSLANRLADRSEVVNRSLYAEVPSSRPAFHRVNPPASLIPLRDPSSALQNPMGGLLISLADPLAQTLDLYSWPTLSLFNVGRLKRRTSNLNSQVILSDFIKGWPWYKLFRTLVEVESLKSGVCDLNQLVTRGNMSDTLSAVEEKIQAVNSDLFKDLMAWHQRGIPCFKGEPFCSANTFASLLTIVGNSDLGLKTILLKPLGQDDAKLVSDLHRNFISGEVSASVGLLIQAFASPMIFSPTDPEKLGPALRWCRDLLTDTARSLIDSGRVAPVERGDLQVMLMVSSIFDSVLEWTDSQTLSFMGQNEFVPLDRDSYLGWAAIEPSLGLRLLEVYVFSLHRSFLSGYWNQSTKRIHQLQTVGYHLNTMCDIISHHVDPSVHKNSSLTQLQLRDILDQIRSKVTHINVYASGKINNS
eukprot:GHVH01001487.1.p1 GENE.GHVH01001487.1~~GHVH01001487.1.p1  ORF type:complete len:725 (+),score=125.13 GHVH01001487.1:151-2325(+)